MTVCDQCGELTMDSITICNDCLRDNENWWFAEDDFADDVNDEWAYYSEEYGLECV